MPLVISLSRQNVTYVSTPKVASTTMIEFMHALAGEPPVHDNPRKAARKPKIRDRLKSLGVESHGVASEQLADFKASQPDHYWVAVKRDPYKRIVSAYHSKVHRYAENFDRAAFWKGTIGRLRNGLKAIDDSRYLSRHVGLRITFDEMVRGLMEHGIDFDGHFEGQARILSLDSVTYDRVIDQENLEAGLREVCQQTGHAFPFHDGIPRRNTSFGPERLPVEPAEETLRLICQLYAEDFDKLGYSMPVG